MHGPSLSAFTLARRAEAERRERVGLNLILRREHERRPSPSYSEIAAAFGKRGQKSIGQSWVAKEMRAGKLYRDASGRLRISNGVQ